MNKRKKVQLAFVCIVFILILGAYLSFRYYMNHLPEEAEETAETYEAINIDTSLVTEIGIISGNGTVNLQKTGDEWLCIDNEEEKIDSAKVESFLSSAGQISSELKIEEVDDMSEYGLDNPSINITLQWDNNLYVIKTGDYNSITGYYYLSVNDDNNVYTIDGSLYYSLNKALEAFIADDTEATNEEEENEDTEAAESTE